MAANRLEELKKYLAEEPEDAFLQYAFAVELIAMDQHEDAYVHLKQLIEKQPDYLAAYYLAGKEGYLLNQSNEAKNIVLKGMELAKSKGNRHTAAELQGLLDEYEE